jgi:hypothetical protein
MLFNLHPRYMQLLLLRSYIRLHLVFKNHNHGCARIPRLSFIM